MKRDELEMLTQIAKVVADRDLAVLARLRGERERLGREAEVLAAPEQVAPDAGLEPAVRTGAAERWNCWRLQELRRLQAQRARLAVFEETAKDQARKSFGRQTALDELAKKAD